MRYEIKNHLLYVDGKQVKFIQTPNGGGRINPIGIVNHHTASGDGSATGDISWLTNRKAGASAHFVVDWNGDIVQLQPCNKKTWHAGKSKWKDKRGLNSHTIGIEIDNPGHLTKLANGNFDGIGGPYTPDLVVDTGRTKSHGGLRYWKRFSAEQISAVKFLNMALAEAYNISPEWVVTHWQIAPRRKTDPGPHFPLGHIRGLIRGNGDDDFDSPVTKSTKKASSSKKRVLVKGMQGADVKTLQRALKINADGDFGKQTHGAVIAIQRSYKLDVDGKVGKNTRKVLGI